MLEITSDPISGEELCQNIMEFASRTAIFQGRVAYCLMSIHAVNPAIFHNFSSVDPYPYLWANMLYGIAVLIYTRPSLRVIVPINRLSFGLLGSLMFNHASMVYYRWLTESLHDRPFLITWIGFASGRIMMIHLLAFLYHLDSRSFVSGPTVQRNVELETMYL